jgi:hypothetical protein
MTLTAPINTDTPEPQGMQDLYTKAQISTEPSDYINWCTNQQAHHPEEATLFGAASLNGHLQVFPVHPNQAATPALTGFRDIHREPQPVLNAPRGTIFFKHTLENSEALTAFYNQMHSGDSKQQALLAWAIIQLHHSRLEPKAFDPFEL